MNKCAELEKAQQASNQNSNINTWPNQNPLTWGSANLKTQAQVIAYNNFIQSKYNNANSYWGSSLVSDPDNEVPEVKQLNYQLTHANSIVELKFKTFPKKGWFKEHVEPMVTVIKIMIPASAREYDGATYKWSLAVEYWTPMQTVFMHNGWTLVEDKPKTNTEIPGVKVDEEYAENFYKNNQLTTSTESIESIASKLSTFLGVPITTQKLSELKKLYRSKAREYHPDFNNGDGSKMSELNRLWTLYNQNGKVN